jgi:hypothetical protein
MLAEAAFFLAKSGVGLGPNHIADLSGTYFEANRYLVQTLAKQSIDTIIGFVLLVSGLILALSALPLSAESPKWIHSLILSLATGVAIFTICWIISNKGSKRIANKALKIIDERRITALGKKET